MLQERYWELDEMLFSGVLWNMTVLKPKLANNRISVEISFGDMTHEGLKIANAPVRDKISSRIIVYTFDFRIGRSIVQAAMI
jgi:hypothetical protein